MEIKYTWGKIIVKFRSSTWALLIAQLINSVGGKGMGYRGLNGLVLYFSQLEISLYYFT